MSKKTQAPVAATVKRGRPTVTGSKRQAVLAMRAAKVAAGGEIKRGRPAGTAKVKVAKKIIDVAAKAAKKIIDVAVEPKAKLTPVERLAKYGRPTTGE